ncbi:MAG: hypothetical protein JXN60_09365, partial [Lentisphaerae bacterium]|nr:hypothetical protein [Lentisphaerota bacterium]
MKAEILIRILSAYVYAVFPYLCFFFAIVKPSREHGIGRNLLIGAIGGTAMFCIVAHSVSRINFNAYNTLHMILSVMATAALLIAWLLSRDNSGAWRIRKRDIAVAAIMILALVVRVIPLLVGNESLGGGDARFHNFLAKGIITYERLPDTWQPAAAIRVMYPRGSHVLISFIASKAQCDVHHAFNLILAIVGALTTGMIYLLAVTIFGSRKSAFFAATSYGFIAYWGSLDYFRWGGLPNAMAMLFLCLFFFCILQNQQGS